MDIKKVIDEYVFEDEKCDLTEDEIVQIAKNIIDLKGTNAPVELSAKHAAILLGGYLEMTEENPSQ